MRRIATAVAAALVVSAMGAAVASSGPSGPSGPFVPALHRKPPDLENHGWTPRSIRIVAFVPAGYPDEKELVAWPQAVVHSTWLADIEKAYDVPTSPPPVGLGFLVSSVPTLPGHDVSTRSVFDAWAVQQFLAHSLLPVMPGYQTIVVIFHHCNPPQSLDGFGCTSHHPAMADKIDSYALSMGDPTGTADARRDSLTTAASHELAEAITDTHDGWRLTAVNKDQPWAFAISPNPLDQQGGLLATPEASPFVEDEGLGTIEAGDELSGARWYESFTPPGFSSPVRYEYVRVFSKQANDHSDDPGVPPSPAHDFYNVTTASDWYLMHLGKAKSVTITGWSTRKLAPWAVAAKLTRWTGGSKATVGATPAPAPCRLLSGTSETVGNGDAFELVISTTSAASAGDWCLVRLRSTPLKPDPNGDTSHVWFVGFILQQ